jgi:hypothetical protein
MWQHRIAQLEPAAPAPAAAARTSPTAVPETSHEAAPAAASAPQARPVLTPQDLTDEQGDQPEYGGNVPLRQESAGQWRAMLPRIPAGPPET